MVLYERVYLIVLYVRTSYPKSEATLIHREFKRGPAGTPMGEATEQVNKGVKNTFVSQEFFPFVFGTKLSSGKLIHVNKRSFFCIDDVALFDVVNWRVVRPPMRDLSLWIAGHPKK